jgi:uncharacterized membrane protein
MWDYWLTAMGAWLVSFMPFSGIHIAIPVALAAGLDKVSAMFWAVFGNYTPLVLIHVAYERLEKVEKLARWMRRFVSEKYKAQLDRYGPWFVLLTTPWLGVWTLGITTKAFGMEGRPLLIFGLISLVLYAVVIAYMAEMGIEWFWQ